jgi:DNA-directed RNA polymerase subunit RPC12/RpoP
VIVKKITEYRCEKCGKNFKVGDCILYVVREDESLGYIHLGCIYG